MIHFMKAPKKYDHSKIEKKWQKEWAKKKLFETSDETTKPKYYVLDMFPYPSGEGLHVGHPKGYIATDIVSRMKRMQGHNVLHPMGFDAFGLPAENYAIKTKTQPAVAVKKNIERFKKQLEIIGLDYDWSREVNTTDPKFYKWTQWIFLKLLEKGLAYESNEPVNWCPVDKTILANEDVEQGHCERCGALVEKRPMRQWVLKITDYADRLLADLDGLDWAESIKESQRNWIGRSEGAEIEFQVDKEKIKVFTTRPDTLFGVTFIAVSPELAKQWLVIGWPAPAEVKQYIEKTLSERVAGDFQAKEKTGISAGFNAINPANGENVPVWIVNYVLGDVGTGAIMGVPAHDERDLEFAKKYNLPIKEIIPGDKKEMTEKYGKSVTRYKLRDWVFSRQRYWGEPIPVLHDGDKVIPLEEKDLPLELPKVKSYEPTGEAESPLAGIPKWVNVKIGSGKDAKIVRRETNTMPQWAGSSWYYLRYMDPHNDKALVDKEKEKYWNQVDLYVGGAEHATRHLIYARFWHKFLYDIGVVADKEPFQRLQSVGLILAQDGRKMSKRFGNVVNPDDIVKIWGADSLRLFEMFMGPFDQPVAWSTDNIIGVRRFLEKVWRLQEKVHKAIEQYDNKNIEVLLNKTIQKVTEDIEAMRFNTAVSAMMVLVNEFEKQERISQPDFEKFLKLLSPFAPHIVEEIWSNLGNKESITFASWPKADESKMIETSVTIIVQVDGKVRGQVIADVDSSQEAVLTLARQSGSVSKWLGESEPKKVIYVKNRLINIVL
jgi:leucyl-tRNA synthetase